MTGLALCSLMALALAVMSPRPEVAILGASVAVTAALLLTGIGWPWSGMLVLLGATAALYGTNPKHQRETPQ